MHQSATSSGCTKRLPAVSGWLAGVLYPGILLLLGVFAVSGCRAEDTSVAAKARRKAEEAMEKAVKSEIAGLREPLTTLNTALREENFDKANEAALRIDTLLQSDCIGPVVRILEILRSDGVKQAQATLTEHLKREDLREADRMAFEKVLEDISGASNHDIAAVAGSAVYVILVNRLSHNAAVPAALVQKLIESLPIGKPQEKTAPKAAEDPQSAPTTHPGRQG